MRNYCGTDIIEVDRVKNAIERTPGFKEKVFTRNEITFAENKGKEIIYQYYAGRFAAKEAVYKGMSNFDSEIEFNQIEIMNDLQNKNRPYVKILKENIWELQQNGEIIIDVSISHIKEYATGMATVEVNNKK